MVLKLLLFPTIENMNLYEIVSHLNSSVWFIHLVICSVNNSAV